MSTQTGPSISRTRISQLTSVLALVTLGMSRMDILSERIRAELMVDKLVIEDKEQGDDEEDEE